MCRVITEKGEMEMNYTSYDVLSLQWLDSKEHFHSVVYSRNNLSLRLTPFSFGQRRDNVSVGIRRAANIDAAKGRKEGRKEGEFTGK